MAHMKKQIYDKALGWRIDTTHGTEWLPATVVPVPVWMKVGVPIDEADDEEILIILSYRLRDYVEGTIELVEVVEGYFGRFSAPGYLDCTPWCFGKTLKEVREQLTDD